MEEIYGDQQRLIQDQFNSTKLADRLNELIVDSAISDDHRTFIERQDMFFLTTVDHRGYPTCSYKGGARGFVNVLDNKTLIFPSYNGNGMFLSMGNILEHQKIGMLFIDFETPHRLRIHGQATIDPADPLLQNYHEAEFIVRVSLTEIFVNCPRYIHTYLRNSESKYIPKAQCETPVPQWKQIDLIQDALPKTEVSNSKKTGGVISVDEYAELLRKGQG